MVISCKTNYKIHNYLLNLIMDVSGFVKIKSCIGIGYSNLFLINGHKLIMSLLYE